MLVIEAMNIITKIKQNVNPHVKSNLPESVNPADIRNPRMLARKNDCDKGIFPGCFGNIFDAMGRNLFV